MRTGIGITTNGRKHLLNELVESIEKHTDMANVTLFINDDTFKKEGVAKSKNNCLRALKDCDFVFLLDDDVRILKSGWVENFIDSEYDHLLYLNDSHNKVSDCNPPVAAAYNDCGGVFMFLTKYCIYNVGAFDEGFKTWGFEHADYSKRIAKLLKMNYNYYSLNNTSEYIYAHDYDTANHVSSITNEEKKKYFDINFPKFKEPIKSIYLPL